MTMAFFLLSSGRDEPAQLNHQQQEGRRLVTHTNHIMV